MGWSPPRSLGAFLQNRSSGRIEVHFVRVHLTLLQVKVEHVGQLSGELIGRSYEAAAEVWVPPMRPSLKSFSMKAIAETLIGSRRRGEGIPPRGVHCRK
jgi:hypothetical protein